MIKTASLTALVFLTSIHTWASCLDGKIDKAIVKIVQEKSKAILDAKNVEVVPRGLPEGKYSFRSMEVKASISGNALVFFTFRDDKNQPGFVSPYSFIGKTNTLQPIPLPDLGNNDSRFWDVKTAVRKNCNQPEIKITYDACSACGGGNDLTGRFVFDETNSTWSFNADP